jgi:hypothetical protein
MPTFQVFTISLYLVIGILFIGFFIRFIFRWGQFFGKAQRYFTSVKEQNAEMIALLKEIRDIQREVRDD